MTRFETTMAVARPRDTVFAYLADPRHFPAWNSAVESVVPLDDATPAVGGRYVTQRKLPHRRRDERARSRHLRAPEELAIRTISGPTPFLYRYRFATTSEGTLVTLYADVDSAAPPRSSDLSPHTPSSAALTPTSPRSATYTSVPTRVGLRNGFWRTRSPRLS
jgi:hypothetical protein